MSTTVPPGLEGNLKEITAGGTESSQWMPFTTRKFYTNAFIVQDQKILLGFKKRGFGKFKYNGFGGKVEPGETSLQAAKRELEEEAGIQAPLEYAGTLLFLSEGADSAFHIDIYRAEEYTGLVTETDEMRPQWFFHPSDGSVLALEHDASMPPIPFSDMWDTDRYWMPLLLTRRKFVGRADFGQSGDKFTPQKWWFGVDNDPE